MAERTALIEARKAAGLSRIQLAKAIGGSRNYVYTVELGQQDPSLGYMRRWVKALGAGADLTLFDNSEDVPADAAENAA